MKKLSFQFVLHSHLPFIKHMDYTWYNEELWLYEAINESYLPLLRMFNKLDSENKEINITMSFSASLLYMLDDDFLKIRFENRLLNLIKLAKKEKKRLKDRKEIKIVDYYLDLYKQNYKLYKDLNKNIISGFKRLYDKGKINIITTAGTYCYMPLYKDFPYNNNTQIQLGFNTHLKFFKKATSGFWIPECAYYKGLDLQLKNKNFKYSYASASSVLFSNKVPINGSFYPIKSENGLYFFVQDIISNDILKDHFTSNSLYRDFYRDIAYDLDLNYIAPYISPDGFRVPTGLKYYSITDKNSKHKELYDIDLALKQIKIDVKDFLNFNKKRFSIIKDMILESPILSNYYNTELFGHKWFEGIFFLEEFLRKINEDDEVETDTALTYLKKNKGHHIDTIPLNFSNWKNSYSSEWLNDNNVYIYKDIHLSIEYMHDLSKRFHNEKGSINNKILNQALRNILMMQFSDWAIIMQSGISYLYADNRIKEHLNNFFYLINSLGKREINLILFDKLEKNNNIFNDIDFKMFIDETL